ncbi:serine hydrolase domain-containing protein [Frateuria terrea]|uniref:CubicO group peptidase, beta-lactamase class C family n=1 Tax=Frateuria terrea TaxID=529704 RepID=A0A1H6S503_9GAMM|nr:serine hydrolase domain-containing protein [Frateuria terrea]SEI60944.1 CubicO group peptidase, beta-lactamase class C family [Frateuria terrea]SFP22558.1 CubicO group peptidase, beta-lactamase class C family [Frateuria terrea]
MRLALLLASLIAAGAVHATDALQNANHLMQKYQGDVPGAALLVIKNGKPLLSKGFGLANLEQHAKVTPDTDFRLASVSKQFTAAAILLLAQDGKLTLDDSIRHWLPSLPATTDKVTLRELLSHTGGLIDYEDLIPPDQTAQLNDQDVLRMLSATPRSYFAPGTAYRYSNSGYVLLGLVVEKASGSTLQDFLQRRIFAPLHMDHTLLYVHDARRVPNRAYGYSRTGGRWLRTDQDLTSATRGDGGIYSNIDDLAKWDAALYDDRLLSDASRKAAFSPHVKVTGEPYQASYGYGWRVTGDTLWHSGESIGFRNVIVRWPKQHLTVILLSNRNDPEPYRTVLKIAQPFLQK